jgi:two-component system chemotaxis sensor kinase CheA
VMRGPRSQADDAVVLLERRGVMMPLVRLAPLLSMTGGDASKAIIVKRNGAPFAFAVDRLRGQQEVVVRPVLDPLVKVLGVSGATDLGDGRPTLMLDLVALTHLLDSGATA